MVCQVLLIGMPDNKSQNKADEAPPAERNRQLKQVDQLDPGAGTWHTFEWVFGFIKSRKWMRYAIVSEDVTRSWEHERDAVGWLTQGCLNGEPSAGISLQHVLLDSSIQLS